ncbi:nuclear transport factor 2 family protein [Amycolatopsis jejuensis]|uniref:nuclear transport factor 2 family protein n=1 Tax=Amycolatopsis jejuensis TaxID=330084 RepID=UPI0005255514|nr:nuclear transport factor 2 family protein [Amycolatopsis jejuensis]
MTIANRDYERLYADRVTFDGGSESDHTELWDLLLRFLEANDTIDTDVLRTIWSADPGCLFFNANGFTYRGLDDWCRIWDFYRPQFEVIEPFDPGQTQVRIRGTIAVAVTEKGRRHKRWVPQSGRDLDDRQLAAGVISYWRATQVFEQTDAGWRVVHAHFSEEATGTRPDLMDEA